VNAAKAASLFDLPHRRIESFDDLPDALAAGTGLIEVKTDRRDNASLHHQLSKRVKTALAEL
jgi:2-succinyl-5-enolpyruvyl-6-hydroxy-3-cyclohexene-1-carboxylate synthase